MAGEGFSVIRDEETGFAVLDQEGKPVVILDSSYEYPHEEKPLIYDYGKTSSAALREP